MVPVSALKPLTFASITILRYYGYRGGSGVKIEILTDSKNSNFNLAITVYRMNLSLSVKKLCSLKVVRVRKISGKSYIKKN